MAWRSNAASTTSMKCPDWSCRGDTLTLTCGPCQRQSATIVAND